MKTSNCPWRGILILTRKAITMNFETAPHEREWWLYIIKNLGPQLFSLTSLLRGQLVKCFTTLLPNTLKFFVEKMREAFALKSFSHFFNKKYWHSSDINAWNFNETLTNNVISFEPGPDLGRAACKQNLSQSGLWLLSQLLLAEARHRYYFSMVSVKFSGLKFVI